MNDADDVMTNIYNILVQLRYPHITKVELKDFGSIILSGENRVYLLSWLLTEKLPSIITQLEKRKNTALEDQLFEYYSQIGICNNKNILLGKCTLKEQLPTLRLLLDFMRKVHIEPFDNVNEIGGQEELMDIVKLYINDADQTSSLVVKPKLNYTKASKYFKKIGKDLLNNDSYIENKTETDSEDLHLEVDNEVANEDRDALFDKERDNFLEAFQSVSSWPMQPRSLDKNTADSICSNIKSICTDFLNLKKILLAKNEISNINIAKGLLKTTTPLTAVIEDIVICNEELKNLSMINTSVD